MEGSFEDTFWAVACRLQGTCNINTLLVGTQDSVLASMLDVAWTSLEGPGWCAFSCVAYRHPAALLSQTQKSFRVCVNAAVLLEAVAEDIREYLRSRRDTIRCIVTMLTDDSAGANAEGETEGESLFEELKRTVADEVCIDGRLSQMHKLVADATNTNDLCKHPQPTAQN